MGVTVEFSMETDVASAPNGPIVVRQATGSDIDLIVPLFDGYR